MLAMTWQDYRAIHSPSTAVGLLREWSGLWSPQLRNQRSIVVALPPDYNMTAQRYPVIYMQDGQNLFDEYTSYSGDWHVDATLLRLAAENLNVIVVGIANAGQQRMAEYSPFNDPRWGPGKGDQYLQFIAQTVKPQIDRDFRTLPQRHHTGILGSSMGGLISLYAFFRRPDLFGFAGALSPSLWFANRAIFRYVRSVPYRPGSLYLDMGGREDNGRPVGPAAINRHLALARDMSSLLREHGYRPGSDLLYCEDADATHSEEAWANRLPDALRFFLRRHGEPAGSPRRGESGGVRARSHR
ncbi:MAG: alpha/beta hydrolase [Herpetosiphon sp.]